uniref:Putative ovule protein n=1 Tax=Solanum chacoense TaxID=4108 RepID=A0A0V0H4U1_SOLCH
MAKISICSRERVVCTTHSCGKYVQSLRLSTTPFKRYPYAPLTFPQALYDDSSLVFNDTRDYEVEDVDQFWITRHFQKRGDSNARFKRIKFFLERISDTYSDQVLDNLMENTQRYGIVIRELEA